MKADSSAVPIETETNVKDEEAEVSSPNIGAKKLIKMDKDKATNPRAELDFSTLRLQAMTDGAVSKLLDYF